MTRHGKVFLFGLLILYLLAALTALILLSISFKNRPDPIGVHQGALLGAYERADMKHIYLESAAKLAYRDAVAILYTDQNHYFGEGGTEVANGCGEYLYSLWSRRGRNDCILDDQTTPTRDFPAKHLYKNLDPKLAELSNEHPLGAFSALFSLTTEFLGSNLLRLRFSAQKPHPHEVIVKGANAGDTITTQTFVGTAPRLIWPRKPAPGDAPEDYMRVTSCFGPRKGVGVSDVHMGFDLPSRTRGRPRGGAVVAAADGIVLNNPQATSYGTVLIKHPPKTLGGRTLYTRYLHLKNEKPTDILVRQGQPVRAGQVIGYAWDTRATAPHLHFEVLVEREGLTKTPHMYAPSAADVQHLYALNPVCFFDEKTLDNVIIKSSETQSTCAQQADPKTAYCDEYQLVFSDEWDFRQQISTPPPQPPPQGEGLPSPVPPGREDLRGTLLKTYDRLQQLPSVWPFVLGAATKYNVPPALLLGIITQESAGDPSAISFTGCCAGLMQLHHLNAQNFAQQNGAKGLTELPHATACWQCGPTKWQCPGSDCTRTADPDCRCNPSNDDRFNVKRNIYAGAELISGYLKKHAFRKDSTAFALAEYNMGWGNLKSWIQQTGISDKEVRWSDVESIIRKKNPHHQTLEYVERVLLYCQAWNGDEPCDGSGTPTYRSPTTTLEPIGTYTWNPTFWTEDEDYLTPFASIIDWARVTLLKCAKELDSERCLLRESFGHNPLILSFDREEKQRTSYEEKNGGGKNVDALAKAHRRTPCSTDPVQSYFDRLALALQDCAENLQWDCTCPLPEPPKLSSGTSTLKLNLQTKYATLDGRPITSFEEIPVSINVSLPLPPLSQKAQHYIEFTIDSGGLRWGYYRNYPDRRVNPYHLEHSGKDFVFVKTLSPEPKLIFKEPSEDDEECAIIKTKYAFCANLTDDTPLLRFALENKDALAPPPPEKPPSITVDRARPKPSCFAPCNFWVCVNGVPSGVRNPACDPPYEAIPQIYDAAYDPLTGYVLLRQAPSDQALYLVYLKNPQSIPLPQNPFDRSFQRIVGQVRAVRDENDRPNSCLLFNIRDFDKPPGVQRNDFWEDFAGDLYIVPVDRAGNANLQHPLRLRIRPARNSVMDWHPLADDEIPLLGTPANSKDGPSSYNPIAGGFIQHWQQFCPELKDTIPLLLSPRSLPRDATLSLDDLWDHLSSKRERLLRTQLGLDNP